MDRQRCSVLRDGQEKKVEVIGNLQKEHLGHIVCQVEDPLVRVLVSISQ